MRKLSLLIFFCLFITTGTAMAADPCFVTKATGTTEGSLVYAAKNCNSTIKFSGVSEATTTVMIPFIKYDNVTLDGSLQGGKKAKVSAANLSGPLFRLNKNNITIKNIEVTYPGSICIQADNSKKRVENVTLRNCAKGVSINNGSQNIVTMMTYENVTTPIFINTGANDNIKKPSDLSAHFLQNSTWELTGSSAAANTTKVEFYKLVGVATITHVLTADDNDDTLDINAPAFSADLTWAQLNPFNTLYVMFIDSANNSSALSKYILPGDVASFLPEEMAACKSVDWFKNGGFNGDEDGDALTNGDEDKNSNCIKDDGEADPTAVDTDGDSAIDSMDNCPLTVNGDQKDSDSDGVGDACDGDFTADADGDGIADALDNCVNTQNADQIDSDGNGVGDACDIADADADGIPDATDNCPAFKNPDQVDTDDDKKGNACDDDADDDGIPNTSDNCPVNSNLGQLNFDGDASGDECDTDDDGDGLDDDADECPLDGDLDCTAKPGENPPGDGADGGGGCSLTAVSQNHAAATSVFVSMLTALAVLIRGRRKGR